MSMEDQAQATELRAWEAANKSRNIEKIRFLPGEPGYGPEFCTSCDDHMPQPRREWGFTVCVSCQEMDERRTSAYR